MARSERWTSHHCAPAHRNARHLTDPANKVYFVGMERELYEVDVNTLAVNKLYGPMWGPYPGTHGKGALHRPGGSSSPTTAKARWSYAKDPSFDGPAGCLAETDGKDWKRPWHVIERTPFTEVTGPGGLQVSPRATTACGRWAGTNALSSSSCSSTANGTPSACPKPATPTTPSTAGTPSGPHPRVSPDRRWCTCTGCSTISPGPSPWPTTAGSEPSPLPADAGGLLRVARPDRHGPRRRLHHAKRTRRPVPLRPLVRELVDLAIRRARRLGRPLAERRPEGRREFRCRSSWPALAKDAASEASTAPA